MKIVQAVGWFYPDSLGGTEVYVAGLARRLRAAGHDVIVAAPDPGGSERRYEHEGLPVYRYPTPALPTRAEAQGGATVRGAERFHAFLADERPDVVHLHTFVTGLGLAEAVAARASGARVIVTTHSASLGFVCSRGTMMRWGSEPCDGVSGDTKCAACLLHERGFPRSAARLMASLPGPLSTAASHVPGRLATAAGMRAFVREQQERQHRLFTVTDRFVMLTRWAAEAVLANGAPKDQVVVNRLGVASTGTQRLGAERCISPVRIGYVGRFDPIKGVDDFVRALRALPPTLAFDATIRGPQTSAAERDCANAVALAIAGDPRITLLPPLTPDEVPAALAALDVLCCPSLAFEGGPTVAIEAHSVGTPVIGTRAGGLAELVTEGINGALVAPGDWRALSDLIRKIVISPSTTVERWRQALPAARTLDEVTNDYLRLYAA